MTYAVGATVVVTMGVSSPVDVLAAVYDLEPGVMYLQLVGDPEVRIQPSLVRVMVGSGPSGGTVYFFIGGSSTPLQSGTLDAEGFGGFDIYISGEPIGPTVIRVGTSATPPALTDENSVVLTVTGMATNPDPPPTPQLPPDVEDDAPLNHWIFQAYDFSNTDAVDALFLPVNPSELTLSFGEYVIDSENTTVSNGRVVSWEGAPMPNVWRWSGYVFDKQQHDALLALGTTGQRMWLTDHLRRKYLVKIATLSMKRRRDIERPWLHEYEMTAWILRGVGVAD